MDKNTTDPRPAETPDPATPAPTSTPDGELSNDDLSKVSGGSSTLTNLANQRHEMLKGIVNNLRA